MGKKKRLRDIRFSVIIVSLNVLFFIFNFSYLIVYILNKFTNFTIDFVYYSFNYDIVFEVYYLQYAFNYLGVYSKFRQVFFYF